MVVRNSWSVMASCLCLVGVVGCHKKSSPDSSSVPVITSFSPAQGLPGITVTVNGSGFDGTGNVSVGGAWATFSRVNDGQLTFVVPDGALTGVIGVVNSLGSGASPTKFYVTPLITAITPVSGGPGTTVTITGEGIGGTQSITFGNGPASTFFVTSANQAQAIVPLLSATGPVTLTVPSDAKGGTTTATWPLFTYTGGVAAQPVLSAFTPAQAVTGTSIAVTGSGFTNVTATKIGGVSAVFTLVNDGSLTIQVPAAAITGYLELDSPLGNVSSTTPFTVAPAITAFSPAQGPAGTLVNLTGSGFVGTTGVSFGNGTVSKFIVLGPNSAQANVAAGSATGAITLTSSGVNCVSASNFTFQADAAAVPSIASISPTQATTGTQVTLTGTGFTGVTDVTVGGVSATTFSVDSDTQITVTVPADAATGFIAAANTLGTSGGSASAFKVVPTLTFVSPLAGSVGSQVTLTGTGFTGASAVTFGGVTAPNFVVVNANTITVTVPAGAVSGAVTVVSSGISCASDTNNSFTVNP